ncbi:hypothetical protein BDW60DRAFT_185833 [Aspergillus nidulans var. acristatus]|jgi:hypothetical protein
MKGSALMHMILWRMYIHLYVLFPRIVYYLMQVQSWHLKARSRSTIICRPSKQRGVAY